MLSCFAVIVLIAGTAFQNKKTLKGSWQFCGGTFNGKPNAAPKDYILQRKYTDSTYEANMLEKGQKPYKYEAGKYKLLADTCLETQTFSALPSQLVDMTMHNAYIIRHDTLVISVRLPNGFIEVDYWKKTK
jgi:hypothetical protein